MVTYAANALARGEIDYKVCHAYGHLADSAIRAYPAAILDDRAARLERLMQVEQNRTLGPVNEFTPRFIFEEGPQTEPESESSEPSNGGPDDDTHKS